MTTSPIKYKEHTYIPDHSFPINMFFVEGIPLHWHDHIEWIYVQRGSSRIQIDAAFETIVEGELVFVNSKQLHSATALTPDTKMICIVFNEALVRGNGLDVTEYHYFQPYLHQRSNWPTAVRRGQAITEDIVGAFNRLVEEFGRKSSGFELLVKAELLRIFGLYFRFAEQSTGQQSSLVRQSEDFAALLERLRTRLAEPISVKEAAATVSLSPNHFCRVFKQLTGKTLLEYVHLLRINEAERLLLDTNWPVTEIADQVGFPNLTYFGRVFKKLKSITPSAIRSAAGTTREGSRPAGN
jgi:AraC-like DNA-binding protein/quercetin dioxygenase-like cupin family protein